MNPKILVIDDDPETLKMINLILGNHGYDLTISHSGKDGLSLAKMSPPDLLLLDVMMPEMDGFEVCRRFRAEPRLAHVPILLFTAKNKPKDKETGFQVGADDFLSKPTNPKELVDRVQMLLARATQNTKADPIVDALANAGKPPINPDNLSKKKNFIGVMGVRGGVGTTTVAINLSASIAEANQSIILADFDLLQGHVAQYLNQQAGVGVHQLANVATNRIQLSSLLTPFQPNIDLLLTASNINGNRPQPSVERVGYLAQALGREKRTIVADLGTGVTPIAKAVMPQLSQMILCLSPERLALNTAQKLIAELRNILPDTAFLQLLLISFNSNISLPRNAVEGSLRHPLLEIVKIPAKAMARTANKGEILVLSQAEIPVSKTFRMLAHQLLAI